MKKKYVIFSIVLMILVYLLCNNHYYDEEDLIGVYINNYDENKLNKRMIFQEAPMIKDTLYLYKNNQFFSKGFGSGVYFIFPAYSGTLISLTSYKNGVKYSGFNTYIRKINILGKPCIEMSSDKIYYYEKIK